MADSFVGEFSSMNSEGRVSALMALVKCCSYREKLDFVERLQKYMHRDFLTDLPDKLSAKIIGYFSFEDALTCLRVCKSWCKIVGDCTGYWEACAEKIGLHRRLLEEALPRYRGLKDLCAAATSHGKHVRSLVSRSIVVARTPAEESHGYLYAGRGMALSYEETTFKARCQLTIERIFSTTYSMVPVASFSAVAFSSRVKWVSAAKDYLVWKQLDGKWLGYDTGGGGGGGGEPDEWSDEPLAQGFHSVTLCSECHLVVIVSEAEDDCEVWDLQVIKLMQGATSPRKMVYPLPLEQIQSGKLLKKRHFLGGDVTLLCEDAQQDDDGFCKSHRVLLQVDNCVYVHVLETVSSMEHPPLVHQLLPNVALSKPTHILQPSHTGDPFQVMEGVGGQGPPSFCVSADSKWVGVVHEGYLYVWNLKEDCREECCTDLFDLKLPPDIKCVALGHIYAILASDVTGCYVLVQVYTGEVCLEGRLAENFNPTSYRSSRFKFFPPLRQEWLSHFEYFNVWPLALALDGSAQRDNGCGRQVELLSVVGVPQNVQRSGSLPLINGAL